MDPFKQVELEFQKAKSLTEQEVSDLYKFCNGIGVGPAWSAFKKVRLGICPDDEKRKLRVANDKLTLLVMWSQTCAPPWDASRNIQVEPYLEEVSSIVRKAVIELDKQDRSRFARVKARIRNFLS